MNFYNYPTIAYTSKQKKKEAGQKPPQNKKTHNIKCSKKFDTMRFITERFTQFHLQIEFLLPPPFYKITGKLVLFSATVQKKIL